MKLWVADDRFEEGCREAKPSEILRAAAEVLRVTYGDHPTSAIEHAFVTLQGEAARLEAEKKL